MLDADTKRRIDTARDILVGKVPDPKSQVEQITIALIYKFMDDMDAESEELGGKRKFFAGPFKKYGWAQLMRSGLGGHETLERYSEAITRMPENPGIPPLFRDIFKNAFLPYRDPETLRAFLKIIDEFNYDHSERLGDAFEYLLSVLGSQGDAGQFRTPRHIIDFMVEITAPQKHETILDPACGTAGFLISAYKYILRTNIDKQDRQDKKKNLSCVSCSSMLKPLTPDEKARLAKNLTGYDISPDMVRLSLVNLYLHGFTDPHIHEYDTLTSQDRWNEYADVILANPPFMSPKGGIRPHNRFSVQSKRSEVLFVDYMAEHLTPDGRAAIIVPEGIIFQSQNAYKQLRKMLVEEYLIAVVSLPAGVFQPYSGVKTSILVLDKKLARRCPAVAFFKIENDGFGLGAQRRPIDQNDLPAAVAAIKNYKLRITNGEDVLAENSKSENSDSEFVIPNSQFVIVPRARIAENGDYNLSGERYREGKPQSINYPWHKIGKLVETISPPIKIQKTSFAETGSFPIIDQSQNDIAGWTDDKSALITPCKPLVIFGDHTCAVKLIDTPFAQGADGIKILQTCDELDPRFLYYLLRVRPLESSGYQRHFSKLKEYEIPLPPLSVQQEIVAEIEGYQNVINGARAVLDNYRPHIPIRPDWPMVELGEVCDIRTGKLNANAAVEGGEYPFFTCSKDVFQIDVYAFDCEAILLSGNNASGDFDVKYYKGKFNAYQRTYVITIKNNFLDKMTYGILRYDVDSNLLDLKQQSIGGLTRYLTLGMITSIKLPLPPLATQQAIVAEIEAEQALVHANRELIARMEKKIQDVLARVWGEEISHG